VRKLKNRTILLLVACLLINFIGCSKRDESLQAINKYYDNIKSKKHDINYENLASYSQNIWTKEEYQAWEDLVDQVYMLKFVKIKKANEFNNKELDGTEYENVVEYNITETNHNNTNDKDEESNSIRYVVKENGEWRIYREKEDPKERIASTASILASMYALGRGKNQDLPEAISILNDSIRVNSDYSSSYYLLGLAYIKLGKYDDAIRSEQQCIDKSKNAEEKSWGYYGLAETYEWEKDYSSAKEYYQKAFEENPNNKAAKESLANLSSK